MNRLDVSAFKKLLMDKLAIRPASRRYTLKHLHVNHIYTSAQSGSMGNTTVQATTIQQLSTLTQNTCVETRSFLLPHSVDTPTQKVYFGTDENMTVAAIFKPKTATLDTEFRDAYERAKSEKVELVATYKVGERQRQQWLDRAVNCYIDICQ